MMERGKSSARAGEIGDELRRSVMAFELGTGREQEVYSQALTLVQDFDEYRALEYPFDGNLQVTPEAFELILDEIETGAR